MINVLIAVALGILNAWRGNGNKVGEFTIPNLKVIPNSLRGKITSVTKPVVLLAMYIGAYIMCGNALIAISVPAILAVSWTIPGGTGRYMPYVIKYMRWIGFENATWRFFEYLFPFLLLTILGSIYG